MGLLAAYSFAGSGSTIVDDSGNGHDFTMGSGTVRASGGGLTRSSTGQTPGPAVFGSTALRSISGRLARSSTALDAWFPGWEAGGTGQWGLIDLSGQRQARARNAGGPAAAQVAAVTGEVAFACTYDGTNLKLYIGGSLVATTALAAPLLATATDLFIFDGSGTETVLKDLRIYDHALSPAEVITDRDTPVSPLSSTITGTFTGTLPGFTGALTGNAAARGDAAGPIPAMVGAFTGRAAVEGAQSGMLPALVGAFTGDAAARGSAAGPIPGFVGSFAGSVGDAPSGVLGGVLPAFTGHLVAAVAGGPEPRDLTLTATVKPDRWLTRIEPDRWRTEVEPS